MLMQDSLTGYLHEVPDFAEAEPYGEVAYDGLGNQIGFFGRRRRRRRAPEPVPQAVPPPMPPEGGEEMPGDEEMGEVAYDGLGNPVGFNPFKAIGKAVGGALTLPFRALQAVGRATGLPVPGTAAGLLPSFLAQRLAGQRRAIQQYQMSGRPVPPALMQSFQNISAQLRRARMRGRHWPLGWRRPPLPYTGLGPRRLYMRCAVWPGPKGLVPAYAAQMPAAAIQQAAQMAAQRAAAVIGRRRRRRRRRR
jgi:hypothetical protein